MIWSTGMGWGGWLLMGLTMVAFWALVVFGVVALFRGAGSRTLGPDRDREARQILDERFARGEIDADEYRTRRGLLPPARP